MSRGWLLGVIGRAVWAANEPRRAVGTVLASQSEVSLNESELPETKLQAKVSLNI